MATRSARIFLGLASLLSVMGGTMHAIAFRKATVAYDASCTTRFFIGSAKGLWLADSATLFLLAILFGFIAFRPASAARPVVFLIALIPAATGIFIYTFLGGFIAGHLLIAIAILAFIGASQLSSEKDRA